MANQPVTSLFNRNSLAEILVNARKTANLTRDEVIRLASSGFARSSLQAWESGEREPKLENLFDLAKIYNIHPWMLISGDMETPEPSASHKSPDDEYAYIPAYDIEASAGHGLFSDGAIQATRHLAFRCRWLKARGLHQKDLAVLFTKGDSMTPTIPEGAAVVIDQSRNHALDGKIYVIRIDDRLYVKRTQWIPTGGLRLISDNTVYDSFDITPNEYGDQFHICGQVIHASYDLPD